MMGPLPGGGAVLYSWESGIGNGDRVLAGARLDSEVTFGHGRIFSARPWMGLDYDELYLAIVQDQWTFDAYVSAEEVQRRVDYVLVKWKEVLEVFTPRFAIIDHYHKQMAPRLKEDPLQRAWGVTVYGPDLVDRLGRDRVLAAPAVQIEELPWGGIWVQAAPDPFQPAPATKRQIEKHLRLKEGFGPG